MKMAVSDNNKARIEYQGINPGGRNGYGGKEVAKDKVSVFLKALVEKVKWGDWWSDQRCTGIVVLVGYSVRQERSDGRIY